MKKIYSLLLALCTLTPTALQAKDASVEIFFRDGSSTTITFEYREDIRPGSHRYEVGQAYSDTEPRTLLLNIDDYFEVPREGGSECKRISIFSTPLETVDRLQLHNTETNVNTLTGEQCIVNLNNGTLVFMNLDTPIPLTIAYADGTIALSQTITTDSTIDLAGFQKGFLLINAGSRTFKYLNR